MSNQKVDPRTVQWICLPCATQAGTEDPRSRMGVFHEDLCGVCGRLMVVTEPRDFIWPEQL